MMDRAVNFALVVIMLIAASTAAAPRPALLEVKSTLAGTVLAEDLVEEGARVEDAQPLVYVRTTLTGSTAVAARAPQDGMVRDVLVKAGQRIERGDVVVRVEPR